MNRIPVWSMVGLFLSAGVPLHAGPLPWLPGEPRGGEGVVFNHPPNQSFGPASDTEFYTSGFGDPYWQLLGDNLTLSESANIQRITWWGFYGPDFTSEREPPPDSERMRIRFYGARPEDGLPGQIMFEEEFFNPSRTPTGRIIFVDAAPFEYEFQVDLTTPADLLGGTTYWLEIVQVGDIDSHYRWEAANINDSHAYVNPAVGDWRMSQLRSDLAFRLSTIPEPSALILVIIVATMLSSRRVSVTEVMHKAPLRTFICLSLLPAVPLVADEMSWFDAEPRGGEGVVFNHPPNQSFGGAADTEFRQDLTGIPYWQLIADNLVLSNPASIRRITWWGFYGPDFTTEREPPPVSETMRIRFYAARPGDGLPGQIVFEQEFLNPSRTPTGRIVFVDAAPYEYEFQVDLMTPADLLSETTYWLEVVQVGDIDSHYRWESAGVEDAQAFVNPATGDWRLTQFRSDVAFRLSTIPEPNALVLVIIVATMLVWRKPERR